MKRHHSILVIILMFQLPVVHQLVPHSGATRFIPNWWTTVHAVTGECRRTEDCFHNECCIRHTGSQHRFCLPLRQLGEACRFRHSLVDPSVYLNHCPCAKGLVCRETYTGWVDAECVSLRSPSDQLGDSFRRSILKALKFKTGGKKFKVDVSH